MKFKLKWSKNEKLALNYHQKLIKPLQTPR